MIFESWSNFMPQYTKCACSTQYTLKFINLPLFIILLWIQCTVICQTASIDNMFLVFFYLSFFCLPNLEDCEPAVLTPPHLIRLLVIVLSNKKTISITNYSLFLKRCVIELPCMLDMYGIFFLSVLEDVLFVGWLQHGIHSSFMASSLFWDSNKKVTGLPTPCNLYKCISAVLKCRPSAVIQLQWMR